MPFAARRPHRPVPSLPPPLSFRREARALLDLGVPIILSQVAQVVMGLLDTVMSGQAGAFEQAVVGLGVSLWIPVFIGLMSVVQAVSPIIAHHFGAGDRAAVARDAREGIWLALYTGLTPLLLVPLAPPLLVASTSTRRWRSAPVSFSGASCWDCPRRWSTARSRSTRPASTRRVR